MGEKSSGSHIKPIDRIEAEILHQINVFSIPCFHKHKFTACKIGPYFFQLKSHKAVVGLPTDSDTQVLVRLMPKINFAESN